MYVFAEDPGSGSDPPRGFGFLRELTQGEFIFINDMDPPNTLYHFANADLVVNIGKRLEIHYRPEKGGGGGGVECGIPSRSYPPPPPPPHTHTNRKLVFADNRTYFPQAHHAVDTAERTSGLPLL